MSGLYRDWEKPRYCASCGREHKSKKEAKKIGLLFFCIDCGDTAPHLQRRQVFIVVNQRVTTGRASQ
jgi:hypothetical protein